MTTITTLLMTTEATDAHGETAPALEAAWSWLEVADMHRDAFGDEVDNMEEISALRDMADALRPVLRRIFE